MGNVKASLHVVPYLDLLLSKIQGDILSKQRIWLCVIVALASFISLYLYLTSDMRWNLVSTQFMDSKDNNLYDARSFRIHEDQMISMRLLNISEQTKATFHVGTIENSTQTFQEKAQGGVW